MDSLSARNLRSQQIMFARRFVATRQAGPIIIPRQTSCLCQVQQDVEKEGFESGMPLVSLPGHSTILYKQPGVGSAASEQ